MSNFINIVLHVLRNYNSNGLKDELLIGRPTINWTFSKPKVYLLRRKYHMCECNVNNACTTNNTGRGVSKRCRLCMHPIVCGTDIRTRSVVCGMSTPRTTFVLHALLKTDLSRKPRQPMLSSNEILNSSKVNSLGLCVYGFLNRYL